MFNWYSLPTFAAMLVFWLLACYVLTRGKRSLITIMAGAAQCAAAAYFFGQAMQANASTVEEWRPWARDLFWGATLAPTLWYLLTLFIVRDQGADAAKYLRWIGYPLAVVLVVSSLVLTVAVFAGDTLYQWGAPEPETAGYFRFHAPHGPAWPFFAALVLVGTVGALSNLIQGQLLAQGDARRPRLRWLIGSALIFLLGANSITLPNVTSVYFPPIWFSHLLLAGALVNIAVNVAAYNLVAGVQLLRRDLLHFFALFSLLSLSYALAFVITNQSYSFPILELLVTILIFATLTHAMLDSVRNLFDFVFFNADVRLLRKNLRTGATSAAITSDLDQVVNEVHAELAEASSEHLVRLTQEALRKLNTPSSLATCSIIERLPNTIAAAYAKSQGATHSQATPLVQAQVIRETIAAAIERLKPPESGNGFDAPGALQYHILHEEYLLGMPNKQIMVRHSISEGTFHRNRREAIAALARELGKQEELLSREHVKVGS